MHGNIITVVQADEVRPEPCSDCVAPVHQTIKATVFVLDNVCCLHNAFRKYKLPVCVSPCLILEGRSRVLVCAYGVDSMFQGSFRLFINNSASET